MFDATFQSVDLAAVLGTAQRIVNSKPTIPVLGNVLLKTSENGDGLILSATDTEIGLRAKIKATSVSPGETTISARLLNDLVRSLPPTSVRLLVLSPESVTITAAGFKGKLPTLPTEDFPILPVLPSTNGLCVLPRSEFRDALTRTKFAVTADDTRYYLNGVKIEPTTGSVRLVSTDAHRLSICDADRQGESLGADSILPRKTVEALYSMLENATVETVEYLRAENHIFFVVGESLLISRLIDGVYPDYVRIIPPPADHQAQIDRVAFLSTLRRIATLVDPTTQMVKFSLSTNSLKVSTNNSSVGNGGEEIVVTYDGAPVDVGLRVSYAIDFLDVAGTPAVSLGIVSPQKGISFLALGGPVSYRYIVMPMALKD